MASTSDAALPSDSNASLIEQFCSITGCDTEKARSMLEIFHWNLEMAVNMHVDSDIQDNGAIEPVNGIDPEGIRAPIPQSRAVLVDEDHNFHYGLRGRKRRVHSVFDGLRDFRAEAEMQDQTVSDIKKRRTLEDLFRPPLDIMFRGNFESARDFGQLADKWLMVNIQDSQEFSCQVLNRDVWSNKAVKKLIAKHFTFWQVYSDSVDGQRYMQFYKPVEFPYIAILDPRTGEKLVVWHNVDVKTICELIELFLAEHNTSLEGHVTAVEGTSKSATSTAAAFSLLDQSEEEQLKAALAASVEENLVNVEDVDSDIETFESDSESVGGSSKTCHVSTVCSTSDHSNDAIDAWSSKAKGVSLKSHEESNGKVKRKDEIKTWKDFLGGEDDPKSDLVLRLPDGKREQISWPCTTKVKSLLLYIAEIGYNPEEYELVTNYPRRNLCQLDLWKSLKEVDLFPREMVFVQLKT